MKEFLKLAAANAKMTVVTTDTDAIEITKLLAWPIDMGLCEVVIVKESDFDSAIQLTSKIGRIGLIQRLDGKWAVVKPSQKKEGESTPDENTTPTA